MEKVFVIPFTLGVIFLFTILIIRGIKWIHGLSKLDKLRLLQMFRTTRVFTSIKESFVEGLIHHNIYKKNPVLGYMHMSLAFGWFLLIVFGHLEVMCAEKSFWFPYYLPIFFRYFDHGSEFMFSGIFSFLMDFFLAVVLSGVLLAIIKRFRKKMFGMKKTTKLKRGDKFALASLWWIFPLRLLAEACAAELYGNGNFLTTPVGHLIGKVVDPQIVNYPLWFAYSLALGTFFCALPYSRYMHIPTEILFIFLRNAGICLKKQNNTFTDIQVYSCSRCGICLDSCQLIGAGINNTQSVYLLKSIRNHNLTDEDLFNCLLCGKCKTDCPVGIDTIGLRITQRIESTSEYNSSYEYLEHTPLPTGKADTVYFAGCMTHLTPSIIESMKKIFALAGENVWFMDEEKAPCCGRPLMLAGQYEAASKLIEKNTRKILESGAKTLVVSCPICYKVFKEDYDLGDIEVLFHAEYILRLIQRNVLKIQKSTLKIIYHDPCELGRGMLMYEEPREVLNGVGQIIPIKNERSQSHCCGGSLGNLKITQAERNKLRANAINDYATYNPEVLVTACPLCKKTFGRNKIIPVFDISEIVVKSIDLSKNGLSISELIHKNEIREKQNIGK